MNGRKFLSLTPTVSNRPRNCAIIIGKVNFDIQTQTDDKDKQSRIGRVEKERTKEAKGKT